MHAFWRLSHATEEMAVYRFRLGCRRIAAVFARSRPGAEPGTDANASSQEEFRTWTDRSGTYHADAVLVEFKDGKVTLKKKDGTTVKVPLRTI